MNHKTRHGAILSGFLCSTALLLTGAAHAQQSTYGLEEIVVTAQKREEGLQTVPISVAAITGASLANKQVTNIAQLANSIPNVQINSFSNSPDSAVFTIRGIGVNDADPYVGTTVSVVVDGVVVGVNTAALLSLFDIERVEVLRGPQGTLFGANTTGGVINVITKQPTGEFGGEAQVSYGNYNRVNANMALNFPISENLSGKVSVLHTSHDGFFRNTVDNGRLGRMNVTSLRGYLRYDSGDYDATLIGEYSRTRNGSQTSISITDPSQVLFIPGLGTELGLPRHRRGHPLDFPDSNDRDTYSVTLTQNLASSFGDWVSITNYREYEQDLYSNDDATEFQLLQTRRRTDHYQFTQELRNTIDITDSVQLLIGGFGLFQRYELLQDGVLDGFLPGLGQPQTQWQKNHSLSAFSQVYVDLTDQLRLQGGFRYTYEKTKARSTTANTLSEDGGPASFNDPLIPGSLIVAEGRESWNEVGYKLGLDFQPQDDLMFYGYYARGFKSGGFTGRIVVAEDIGPYDPEKVDTFEIGMKTDFLDRRMRLNVAAFYNKYKNMQVVQNLTLASGANSATIRNAARATTKGFEAEVTALPVEGLTLALSGAYLDASYKEFDTLVVNPDNPAGPLIPFSFAGNDLMNAPKWSGAASLTYEASVGNGIAEFFAEHTFADRKYTNFTNFPQERTRRINLTNATVSWRPDNERWQIGAYGRNIFDKKYFSQLLYLPGTFALGQVGAPAEYGVDFRFNW